MGFTGDARPATLEAAQELAIGCGELLVSRNVDAPLTFDERQMLSPDIVEEVFSLLQKHRLPPASGPIASGRP